MKKHLFTFTFTLCFAINVASGFAESIPDPNKHTCYYYAGGKKVFLEAVPGEYFVEIASEDVSLVEISDISLNQIFAANEKLSRISFLPPTSPYRVVQVKDLQTGQQILSSQFKEMKNYQRILWKTPVMRIKGTGSKIYLTNRVIARFTSETSAIEIANIEVRYGIRDVHESSIRKNRVVFEVPTEKIGDILDIANTLQEIERTLWATPEFETEIKHYATNDPLYPQQWHLNNQGGNANLQNDADVDAPEAWSLTEDKNSSWQGNLGTHAVIISVQDLDGVEGTHPDLQENLLGSIGAPDGPHGTCCAGIAVGRANGIGIRGIAPFCGLYGLEFTDSTAANRFEWSQSHGASVISNSWGAAVTNSDIIDAINEAALNGREGKGCVIFFAAGNDHDIVEDQNPYAALTAVVCVGASTSLDHHATYSNQGRSTNTVDLVAPSGPAADDEFGTFTNADSRGQYIYTVDRIGTNGYNNFLPLGPTDLPDMSYTSLFSGTSAATPLAAGVGGLVISVNPDLDANDVKQILYDTADMVNDPCYLDANGVPIEPNYSEHFGHGRVNAYEAVKKALIAHYTTGDLRLQDIAGVDWSLNPVTISAGQTFELTDLVLDSNQRQYIDRVVAAWLVLDVEDVDNETEMSVLSNLDRLMSHCPPTGSGQRRPVIMSIPPSEVIFQEVDEPFKLKNNDSWFGSVKLYGATLRLLYVLANSETDPKVTGGFRFPTGQPGSAIGWLWGYLDSDPEHVTSGSPLEQHANTSSMLYDISRVKAARLFVTGRAIGRGEATLKINGVTIGTLPMVTNKESSVRTRYIGVPTDLLSSIITSGDNTLTLEGSDFYVHQWGLTLDYEGQSQQEKSIENGIAWLRQNQNPNGSWTYSGRITEESVGLTAMAATAFLNYGIAESDSDVGQAIQWIIGKQRSDGAIVTQWYETYDTALAVLSLVATRNPNYRDEIEKAVGFLLRTQNDEDNTAYTYTESNPYYGGWSYMSGYHPWADLSNTQFVLLALHYAEQVNPSDQLIPAEVWEKVLIYLQRCQNREASNPDFNFYDDGGFIYIPSGTYFAGGRSYASITAAGLWGYYTAGVSRNDPRVQDAWKWFENNYYVNQNYPLGDWCLYYYLYGLSKACVLWDKPQVGGHVWYDEMTKVLVDRQQPDGHWPGTNSSEEPDVVATSWALLALETKLIPTGTAMEIRVGSPVDLHVYDAQGRHVGLNYDTGEVEINIPGASYSGPGTEPQIIRIENPGSGTYTIGLIGTDTGSYSIAVTGYIGDEVVSTAEFTGSISQGEAYKAEATISAIAGAITIDATEPSLSPTNVGDNVGTAVSHVGYDHHTEQFGLDVTVPDTSRVVIGHPLWLAIESISDVSVTLANRDGLTAEGKPYIDLSALLGDDEELDPGESITKRIYFNNPDGVRFTFEPSVRGVILSQGEGSKGGMADLARLSGHWLGNEPALDVAPPGGDGIINLRDFAVLAERWRDF